MDQQILLAHVCNPDHLGPESIQADTLLTLLSESHGLAMLQIQDVIKPMIRISNITPSCIVEDDAD